MSHISVHPNYFTTKSAGYIIRIVFLVTLLILNHIGQGGLHNVSCDWSILKIHFHKMESCYSRATASITCQTISQICQNINRYLPYGTCQAIGNNICHPCWKYPAHEKMTKIVWICQKASLQHDHLTAQHIRTGAWVGHRYRLDS